MLYFFRLLFLLIHVDQETVLKWFGILDSNTQKFIYEGQESDIISGFSNGSSEPSTDVSIKTLFLIVEGLWNKLQNGLSLADIENILFFILFVRFVLLAIKYNLKTSFYITCITLVAGYLWYRHLIDVMLLYRTILLKLPFFHKLGTDAFNLSVMGRQAARNSVMLGENVHWYDVGQLVYYTFTKGIVDVDPVTGLKSYIDPLSMWVANLDEPMKSNVIPYYYKLYNKIIPKIFSVCSKFWTQLSGVVAYALITRIGKRYCPYLVRWHWTILLILGFPEQLALYFTNRIIYFQSAVLLPQLVEGQVVNEAILLQINALNIALASLATMHISFVLLALLHAICGQYFYVPFFVENAELHIGPRPKNSVYSGGYTSWQDEKQKNTLKRFPTLWYGWLGKRNTSNWKPIRFLINYMQKVIRIGLKKLRKRQ